jgi:hypothetical protein
MIKIECKGYVRKPEQATSKGGKSYVKFGFSTKTGKDKDGKATYTWLNCMNFAADAALPKDGDFMVLKGGLGVSVTEKEGKRYTNHDVFVDSLDAAPPRDGESPAAAPAAPPAKDPWE